MITYILKTKKGEYYCGKTNDLGIRLENHRINRKDKWFGSNQRHQFELQYYFSFDCEKQIKRCGIKLLVKLLNEVSAS